MGVDYFTRTKTKIVAQKTHLVFSKIRFTKRKHLFSLYTVLPSFSRFSLVSFYRRFNSHCSYYTFAFMLLIWLSHFVHCGSTFSVIGAIWLVCRKSTLFVSLFVHFLGFLLLRIFNKNDRLLFWLELLFSKLLYLNFLYKYFLYQIYTIS